MRKPPKQRDTARGPAPGTSDWAELVEALCADREIVATFGRAAFETADRSAALQTLAHAISRHSIAFDRAHLPAILFEVAKHFDWPPRLPRH